ncbi:MAG: hypothetical protein GY953_48505, partial [bacterium]|nr:hypothetical protein [bacterium]
MRLLTRVLLLCLLASVAGAQLMTGSASTSGGGFSYQTRLEPPTPKITKIGGGTLSKGQVIKRHIYDLSRKTYFGYDLTIEQLENGRYRYTISPLSITPEEMEEHFDSVRGW